MFSFLAYLGSSFPVEGQCAQIHPKYETQIITFSGTKCIFDNFLFASNNRVKTLIYDDPSKEAAVQGEQYRCVTSASTTRLPYVELQCMESECKIEIIKISPSQENSHDSQREYLKSFIDTRPYSTTGDLYVKKATAENGNTNVAKDLMVLGSRSSYTFTNKGTNSETLHIYNDEHPDTPESKTFTANQQQKLTVKQSVFSVESAGFQSDKTFSVEFPASTQSTMFPAFYGMIPLTAGAYTYDDLVAKAQENEPRPNYPIDENCQMLESTTTIKDLSFSGKLCANISYMLQNNNDIEINLFEKKDYGEYSKSDAYKNVLIVAPHTNESSVKSVITCKKTEGQCSFKYITIQPTYVQTFQHRATNVESIFNTFITTYQSGNYLFNQTIQIRKNEFHITLFTPYVIPFAETKYTYVSDRKIPVLLLNGERSPEQFNLEKDRSYEFTKDSAVYPMAYDTEFADALLEQYKKASDKDNFVSEVKHVTINVSWSPSQKTASADSIFPEFRGYIPMGTGIVTYSNYKTIITEKEPEDPNDPDPTPTPEPNPNGKGLSGGAIAGIVIGCIAAVAIISGVVFFVIKKQGSNIAAVHP